MPKRRRSALKRGLAPGTVVYTGHRAADQVKVHAFHVFQGALREFEPGDLAELAPCRAGGVLWVDVSGIHHVETVEAVCRAFGVHPLAVEDICSVETRPKAEEYGDHLYLVVKMLLVGQEDGRRVVQNEHTSIVLGNGYVLTFQEQHQGDVFEGVRKRLRDGKSRLRTSGADFLAYSLIDAIVDGYFAVLESAGEHAERLEDELLTRDREALLEDIYLLRRELLYLRKQVWPLRDGLQQLLRADSALISPGVRPFLRDVHDHTVQVAESIELYRDMVLGLVDLHMTHVSNRMNEVMKLLTLISTIFIPLTFIVGVYGMNFDNMPELHWRWGYLGVWGLLLVTAGVMAVWFRRRQWL